MRLPLARAIAEDLVVTMEPLCERLSIAGSTRRQAPDVKDIEIVAIPKRPLRPQAIQSMLLGEKLGTAAMGNLLHSWALIMSERREVRWIKPGTPKIEDWPPKPDGKYWRGLLPNGVKLDLFLCTPENWGTILLIRTGSAAFSEAVATHGKRIGKRFHEGWLCDVEEEGFIPLPTPEEQDVFDEMRLAWVDPSARTGRGALRMKSVSQPTP